jgi:hydrogenase maturation protein HypF
MNYSLGTERIRCWGIVQGVGFRPFVARLARGLKLRGEVRNLGGLVEVVITGTEEQREAFVERLVSEKPANAEIVHLERQSMEWSGHRGFTILGSQEGEDQILMIPPDLALCHDCQRELLNKKDSRYLHPFISCMSCGPRFTIMEQMPYDRHTTTMVDFPMCEFCRDQYENPGNRRYHAQTISCHQCGPQLHWYPEKVAPADNWLKESVAHLKTGGVMALKSVGGYHMVADPFQQEAVKQLRLWKQREEKPFALMFSSMDEIRAYGRVSQEEEDLLSSSSRPIVLLRRREDSPKALSSEVYGTSPYLGCFLPSYGAQQLLVQEMGPLIMTSANGKDQPIIKDEDEIQFFMEGKGPILYNQRRILIRVDDSVARVIDKKPQMIRRSKGYVPLPIYLPSVLGKEHMVLALGGDLKAAFCLTKGSFATVSPFFGDLYGGASREVYRETLDRMKEFFRVQPGLLVSDKHPGYVTTEVAQEMAERENLPLKKVQHHHAHVASVMGEHHLEGPVIGVALDGTGYGDDGAVWGGEFFVCEEEKAVRKAHLSYIKMVGGDRISYEGGKAALCYIKAREEGRYTGITTHQNGIARIQLDLESIFDYGEKLQFLQEEEKHLYLAALDHDVNVHQSSSAGRLFDAVAALLGIGFVNRYEGELAMGLEAAARQGQEKPGINPVWDLAYGFHHQLAKVVVTQAEQLGEEVETRKVALSGGVFQNALLMEEVATKLRQDGFLPYYNRMVPPNDGGISLGQAYVAMKELEKESR